MIKLIFGATSNSLLCEEKKIKWFWYTYKFGISKYLIADQNEIGSILFNTVTKKSNEVLIPTGFINVKNGCDSVLYNLSNGEYIGLQYKNKVSDYSFMTHQEINSKIIKILREQSHCDRLVIDTTNTELLIKKFNTDYIKFNNLLVDEKIIFYDSYKWLHITDDKVIESAIEENKSSFETLILEKNPHAGKICNILHEVGDDPKFNELGNYSPTKLLNIKNNEFKNILEKEYAEIHLTARKIINETVSNEILKIKK